MRSISHHAVPTLVHNDQVVEPLQRITLGKNPPSGVKHKAFILALIHQYPKVISSTEVKLTYEPLISICRELPALVDPLDHRWLMPNGGIVLGRPSSSRTQRAHREVVAQALDSRARSVGGTTKIWGGQSARHRLRSRSSRSEAIRRLVEEALKAKRS